MGRWDDEDFQGWKEGKHDNRYDGNFRRAGGKNPYKKSHTGKIIGIFAIIIVIGIIVFAKSGTDLPSVDLDSTVDNANSALTVITENSENILTNTANSIDKNYITISYDPIPDYANDNYVRNSISDAIQQWTDENPDMTIQLVESNGDVHIEWKKVIFAGHTGLMEGRIMDVELGSLDCNNNWNQYSIFSISDTISHELGHYLKLGHSADPTHLMYGEDEFTQIPFDDLGYNIPDNHLDFQFWIVSEKLENEYEQLSIEYNRFPSVIENGIEYQRAAKMYERLNFLADELNCIANVTP